MPSFFSSSNRDWQPALLLWSYRNRLEGAVRRCAPSRDPTKYRSPWRDQAALLAQLILLHLYRVLSLAGVPFARVYVLAVYVASSAKALGAELRRLVSALIGYQYQRLGRKWISDYEVLSGLRRWHLTLGLLVLGGLLYRSLHFLLSCCSHATRRAASVRQQMSTAATFEDWQALASDLDAIHEDGRRSSRSCRRGSEALYDDKLLSAKTAELAALLVSGRVDELVFALRADLCRNFGNITNKDVHVGRHILPKPIRDYISIVQSCLEFIAQADAGITVSQKFSFFREVRHAFGRTALVLSGGGALGAFHLGVVRGLIERGLLPRIIAGSSVGAIVAAITAVHRDHELQEMYRAIEGFNLSFFAHDSLFKALHHLMTKGTLQDISFLVKRLRALLSDVTFAEAYERTGRILNVTVTPADTKEPPRMLNYLTAPQAVVWSAVSASAAFPGLFPAQELLAKDKNGKFVRYAAPMDAGVRRRWHDGSLENDLPFRQLSELFNVNHFVVSQTNPHLVPLMSLKKVVPAQVFHLLETEVKHAFLQAQHYMPRWMPTKWMRLFTQPWEGDVTIVMPWSLYSRSIGRAMYNPSQAELVEADMLGRLAAWEHMSAIQGNCAIEMKLDECQSRVMRAASACGVAPESQPDITPVGAPNSLALAERDVATSRSSGSRIPSWLHIPNLSAFTAGLHMHASPRHAAGEDGGRPSTNGRPGRGVDGGSTDATAAAPLLSRRVGVQWRQGEGPGAAERDAARGTGIAKATAAAGTPARHRGPPLAETSEAVLGAAALGSRVASLYGPPDAGFAVASASSSSGEGLAGHSVGAALEVHCDGAELGARGAGASDAFAVPSTVSDSSDDFWTSILRARAHTLPGLQRAQPSSFGLDAIAP